MKFDYVIVGAGLSGCVVAEQLAKSENKKILIVEKRNHIAGNCYDFRNENNILIHKYGPHIFHTNNWRVWEYLSQFTEWEKYQHKVLANVDGILVPVPFNLNSIYKCFSKVTAEKIEEKLLEKYQFGTKIPILNLNTEYDSLLRTLFDLIYNKVFHDYTVKQWDLYPRELDGDVMARIPVSINRDDRYFQDKYQGIPKQGYTKLIEKMLYKPNIHLLLNTDYFAIKNELQYEKLIFTGMLDEFFEFKFGKLPYRSLKFEFETFETNRYQPVAQVNYPSEYDFTRITEFSHFFEHQNFHSKTTIAREFPSPFNNILMSSNNNIYRNDIYSNKFCNSESLSHSSDSKKIPYYPVPMQRNENLAIKYKRQAKKLQDVIFLGRLADYSYYNMDQAVARALEVCNKILK